MKRPLCSMVLFCVAACGAPAVTGSDGGGTVLTPGTGVIEVGVTNVRSSTGRVSCSLFADRAGFPGRSPLATGTVDQAAAMGPMSCRFERLPPGEYAVSLLHDENGDGELDRNAFGAPTEGYGASNNVLPATMAPQFDDARVRVGEGQRVRVEITLRY